MPIATTLYLSTDGTDENWMDMLCKSTLIDSVSTVEPVAISKTWTITSVVPNACSKVNDVDTPSPIVNAATTGTWLSLVEIAPPSEESLVSKDNSDEVALVNSVEMSEDSLLSKDNSEDVALTTSADRSVEI